MNKMELTCEYTINPIGVDTEKPRLTWIQPPSSKRGEAMGAYQILVASSQERLDADTGDKWDSGKIESDHSVNIPYQGTPLTSGEKCWWKVRVWNETDEVSRWSEPATFEMGLLEPTEWQGKWIGAPSDFSAPLLRKEFKLNDQVKHARAYVVGIGYHEFHINGQKVGDNVMSPAPTYYDNILPYDLDSRVLYLTYDLTDLLKKGDNSVGVMLGHGWYSSDDGKPAGRTPFAEGPALLLQINIELAGGETISVTTDDSWKTSRGPITANDISAGECYDARLEQPGWDRPGFDESNWVSGTEVKSPVGKRVSQSVEPTKITQRLKPTRIMKSGEDSWIFDMGQYIAGWVELRVKGPRGTKVSFRHAGRVNYETQSLDARNSRMPVEDIQSDSYILKGEGVERWHPRFTIHGFRYVEVVGFPGEPDLESVEGCAVNSDVATSGQFNCSNDLLNRIHENVCNTFRGSFQGIPQDAAERSERVAWLGDPGFVAEDYMFNFADARFWSKWLDDIADSQKPDGLVPYLAPPNWAEACYSKWPCWECTYSLFVWFVYQYYDDSGVLEKHYDGIKRQVDSFARRANDYVLDERVGDHMEPRHEGTSSWTPTRTPKDLCGTAYFHRCAWILSQAAGILGRDDDAREYAGLAGRIKEAFNAKFFDPETHQYDEGSQTSNALALYLDLVPEGQEEAVVENLVDDIENKWWGHLSTGIIGTDALEQALPRYGRADVMYGIATKTTFPSWGYGVTVGQTTLSEDFECSPNRSVSMKMFGSIEKFFYKDVAGINPSSPGYRTIAFRPQVTTHLEHAAASIKTVRGLAAVEWKREEDSIRMSVTLPVNTNGTVSIPTLGLRGNIVITEGGREIWSGGAYVEGVEGISGAARETECVTFDVGSGYYSFELIGGKERSG